MKKLLLRRRMLLLNSQSGGSVADENLLTPTEASFISDGALRYNIAAFFSAITLPANTTYKISGTVTLSVNNPNTGYGNIYLNVYSAFGDSALFRKIISPNSTLEVTNDFEKEITTKRECEAGYTIGLIDFGKDMTGTITFTNMKLVKV